MSEELKKFGELLADVEAGEGHVKVPEDFHEGDPLWRIDVIKDWIADLNQHYGHAMKEFRDEFERVRGI